MPTSNNLKSLIFYFLLFSLTGCNGPLQSRLDCQPTNRNLVNLGESQRTSAKTQELDLRVDSNNNDANFMDFCIKASTSKFDNCSARWLEDFLMHVLDLNMDTPSFSSSSIHQKVADSIWSAARTVLRGVCPLNCVNYFCLLDSVFKFN